MGEAMPLGSRGGASIRHLFPVDGEYEISVGLQRGRFDQFLGLERERKLDLRLDGERLELFTIPADPRAGQVVHGTGRDPDSHLKVRVPVKAGTRTLVATFLKDTVKTEGIPPTREANFFEGVGNISVAGPFDVLGPGDTASRDRIFVCHPTATAEEDACAEKILSSLARRAYRRPIAADDLPPLIALFRQGAAADGFEAGVRLALQKILVSPEFIFRMEFDPPDASAGHAHRISDVELASRLSFFLWSSIPDDELLAVAERGELSDPAVLEHQVRRMLADPRSQALVKNFAGQWLFLRNIARIQPDPAAFPNFDENLRQALEQETELLVESTLREDRSIVDLLTADYTFVNQRLAEHYGIKGIYGSEFRRVTVNDPEPAGPARTGEHPDGDLLSEPDGADHPRQMGAGAAFGHAPAAAATQCSLVEGGHERTAGDHAPTHGTAPRQSRLAPFATGSWTRSALRWRTSTASAGGATPPGPGRDRSIPPGFCPTAPSSKGLPACARSC